MGMTWALIPGGERAAAVPTDHRLIMAVTSGWQVSGLSSGHGLDMVRDGPV